MAGARLFRAQSGQAKSSFRVETLAELPQDFADLLIELCEADAEFLLVGGWAVILYGHVRATDDMDIFVRPSLRNSDAGFQLPASARSIVTPNTVRTQ